MQINTHITNIKDNSLLIYGYDIKDLAKKLDFESLAYLLLHDELATPSRKRIFKKKIHHEQHLHPAVVRAMKALPKDTDPLVALRVGINAIALLDGDMNNTSMHYLQQKSRSLLAKLPLLVAVWHRLSIGKPAARPDSKKSLAWNFLSIYHDKEPSEEDVALLDYTWMLYAEHGINPSTLVVRLGANVLADYYSSMISALNMLKGSLHGSANVAVMEMVRCVKRPDNRRVHDYIKKQKKKPIMGVGHAVYKKDPRARLLDKKIGKSSYAMDEHYLILKHIQEYTKEHRGLEPNIDFFSGFVYDKLGIFPQDFGALFACARLPGWSAHYMEQLRHNKRLKAEVKYVGRVKPRH